MSLYNLIHGRNPAAPILLAVLNKVQPIDVGRFRDAWVEADGDQLVIRVHTRNGGGNRECWCEPAEDHWCLVEAIDSMQNHPWYLRDEDDDFDYTYADFYFVVDPAATQAIHSELPELLVALAEGPVDVGERWRQAIEAISAADAEISEP